MGSIGRDIENAIQSMLKVSEDVAELQAMHASAQHDLNMLETLFSVSKYIRLDPQQHVMTTFLEDSIKGVFGAKYCQVMFDKDKTHLSVSKELYNHLEFMTLKDQVIDILVLENVAESDITDLTEGSLIIIKLAVGEELYGFLTCYWEYEHNLSESSILFLQIISNQVSMYLKSNALIDQFKSLAIRDALTDLYNRSYYLTLTEGVVPADGESIIMFDLDHFKQINDSRGHQFGDKILIDFSSILSENAEIDNNTAFRYGGEEFIIMCKGGKEKAFELAEKIRREFEQTTDYTVSVGLSILGYSTQEASYEKLMALADNALYVSKEKGRNKTTVANEITV